MKRTGEHRLRAALKAITSRPAPARKDDPSPYDTSWGWWIDRRLARVETQLKWLIRLALSTLAAEAIRIAISTLNLE